MPALPPTPIQPIPNSNIDGLRQEIAGLRSDIANLKLTPGPQGERGPGGKDGTVGAKGDKGDKGDAGPQRTITVIIKWADGKPIATLELPPGKNTVTQVLERFEK